MINHNVNRRMFKGTTGVLCLAVGVVTTGLLAANSDGGDVKPSEGRHSSLKCPDVVAVRIHADWCGTCRKLDPMYSKLMKRSADLPVLFVTFDMTSKATARQAEYLAGLLNLEQVWSRHCRKAGTIVLVDPERKQVVSSILGDGSLKDAEAKLREAVAG